jgi:Skp family chaperone for outer membrane proteins
MYLHTEYLFKYIIRYLEENMKKSFIIVAIALVVGTLSMPLKAAEDVLIVNLQYVVSQSKSGVSLRKQSEALNKEVVDLRDSISKDLQAKGKKIRR